MQYHSYYSDTTKMKKGELPSIQDQIDRQNNIRKAGLRPIGELWVAGQGYTLLFEGGELDTTTQLSLNIKAIENQSNV